MPTVPRRGAGYVPTSPSSLRLGRSERQAFEPPEPVDIGPAAKQIASLIEQHKQRADEVALLEADNQLAEVTTSLEQTALKRRGKDALNAGPEVEDEWKKRVSEVEATLTSDRLRENFRLRANHRWQNLNAAVQRHGAQEFQKWDAEQTDVGIKKRVETAVTNYADPKQVAQAVAETKYLVELYGSRNGWGSEQVADKQLIATTQIHGQVISRMIADGNDQLADQYFKKNKGEIQADEATKLTQQLEVSSTEGTASRTADDIWKKLGPKSLNDPVVLTAMEQEARDRYADNPKVQKATIQEIRQRREAHNADQTEVTAASKATVLGAFAKGASVSSLTRSAPYLSLSGTEQEQLKSYMLSSRRADANREPDKKNWASYWNFSSPAKLAAMSENQILALVPEVGQSLVNQLMTQKRSILKTDDQVRNAVIDSDLFNTIADDAELKPFEKDADKATLGRLKATVENEIERAQGNARRALTRDEKRTIMQSVIDQKVMLDFRLGDEGRIAALVSKDDRSRAYLPIAQVSATFRRKAISWMRQNGNARPDETETQVMNRFQRRLERAYGAKLTGATDEVIFNILAGR